MENLIEIPEKKIDINQAVAAAVEALTTVYYEIVKQTEPISFVDIQNNTQLPMSKIIGVLNLLIEKGQIQETTTGFYHKGG